MFIGGSCAGSSRWRSGTIHKPQIITLTPSVFLIEQAPEQTLSQAGALAIAD
jgi:hypothetical protein